MALPLQKLFLPSAGLMAGDHDAAADGVMEKGNGELTSREYEVLTWLCLGKTSWDIAVILRISERTVNFHVGNIMQKLDVTSRAQAASVAVSHTSERKRRQARLRREAKRRVS